MTDHAARAVEPRCICGQDSAPQPGDPVRLGAVISCGQEPDIRAGRIVAIRHGDDVRAIERFVLRRYLPDDGAWPTGDYYATWLLVPWSHAHPTQVAPHTLGGLL